MPGNPAAELRVHACCKMQSPVEGNFEATSTCGASVATCKRGAFVKSEAGPRACLWCLKIAGAGRACWLLVQC